MEYFRRKAAKRLVTRGSEPALVSGTSVSTRYSIQVEHRPFALDDGHMVRSFKTHSAAPFCPTRRCATRGDFPENAMITNAIATRKGEKRNSKAAAATRSIACIKTHPRG